MALWPLFWVFLKLGAIVFGSGYVLLAFLRADLVDRLHWLTQQQLLDAVAAGQITPGPVFTTATFIGYLLAGVPGSIVATAAVFLPSFALIALSGPLLRHRRKSPLAGAFLDGVNAGARAHGARVRSTGAFRNDGSLQHCIGRHGRCADRVASLEPTLAHAAGRVSRLAAWRVTPIQAKLNAGEACNI